MWDVGSPFSDSTTSNKEPHPIAWSTDYRPNAAFLLVADRKIQQTSFPDLAAD